MNETIAILLNPSWWITAVVFGIIINLFSAYLKNPIDNLISNFSSRRKSKTEAQRLAWLDRVENIRKDLETRNEERQNEIVQRLRSIHMLLLAIFILLFPLFMSLSDAPLPKVFAILIFAFSSFSFFISFLFFLSATNTATALRQAKKS